MEFYNWKDYRCAFEVVQGEGSPALLLIHPIGVGLSSRYWQPFIRQWQASAEVSNAVYNLDLLGCGQSSMPERALKPADWAEQIAYFIEAIADRSVVLVVQGALLPVAVEVMGTRVAERVVGMVLSGPPAWRLMSEPSADWKQQLAWRFFGSPLGSLFYRYARRENFLRSFSKKQLFENPEDVDENWLTMLEEGARNLDSRYAVFSFLAGFWREDYTARIARIQQPVLVVMGESASTIDRKTAKQVEQQVEESDTVERASQKRLQDYLDRFPRAQGAIVSGRNVMPYEATDDFVRAIAPFVRELSASMS